MSFECVSKRSLAAMVASLMIWQTMGVSCWADDALTREAAIEAATGAETNATDATANTKESTTATDVTSNASTSSDQESVTTADQESITTSENIGDSSTETGLSPNQARESSEKIASAASPSSAPASAPSSSSSTTDALNASATGDGAGRTILSGGASMTPNAANDRIDDITREILLKIIELERFNLHYTLEVAKQGRWKGWRYSGLQEVNAGMGLAGAIIGTAERGYHIHSPGRVFTVVQESANYIPMIGSIIGASAAALEFSINGYHDMIARRKGFSPATARKYVMGVKMDIDRCLADRDALIKVQAQDPSLSCNVQVDNAEGKVLRDLRDQALQEFQRFHIGARKLLAFQQMQYFFDFSKYTLNAIGYDFAYLSLHRHRRLWNGRAGVIWNITGPLIMTGPVISRMWSNMVVAPITKHTLKDTMKGTEETNVATLQADLNMLDQVCKGVKASNATEDAVVHSSMYGLHEKTFENEVQAAEKKRAAARLTATQNIGAGFYVGGTKLAQGVLFTIPGFNQHYNKKGFRADHVTNDDLFVGSVISLPAGLFSMLDTLRIQVKGELQRHKLAKSGMLPAQLVGRRLGELDEMEKALKAM